MEAAQLIDSIYGENIYTSFDGSGFEQDLQGWGGHQFLLKVIQELRPRLIIEVGVWKGRSALAMADKLKELHLSTPIICIDTWLGAQEHFQTRFRPDMNRKAGWPRLYEQFLFNVIDRKHQDIVVPLPVSSLAAAQMLRKMDVKADLIHIDAGHGYLEVRSDIDAFWPLLSEDGVVVFDDYGGWAGVTRAVNEFAAEKALPLIGTHGKALISPSLNMRFRAELDKIEMGKWAPKKG
ncbi:MULTISPECIES: class I SAM-dependent methyltransferase [Paracoccus]|uniref:Class I SAM-dependent methyltransferase n=1 Tax=Paracoccus litorisediminis TaxID=2006130 RepID=A0A844HEM3_9RHOB|nr:class I SAM-dependent methyltransferase [Paracoccus sp. PAR01]MTH57790.1 class I SAM-dependent methyltransferase [Paracoccus litorisediminis]